MPQATGLMIRDGEPAALAGRLQHAVRLSRRGRWLRALAQPWPTALLRFLRAMGRTNEVTAATFFGSAMVVVLPETLSASIWRYGFVEEDVCRFLLASLRPGGRFVDIGAHFGFFTLLGAHLVGREGRVLAVEPTPSTYRVLSKNVAPCPQVEACPCAAFNESRKITFYDYGVEFSAYNSALGLRPSGGRGPTGVTAHHVQARRVDDLLAERGWPGADVIKIDAESAEGHILEGLESTIQASRPAVIIEVGDYRVEGSQDSQQLVAWFRRRRYAPFQVDGTGIAPHRIRERYSYGNLLFVADRAQ